MEREFAALLDECRRGGIEVRVDSRQVSTGDIFVAVPGVNEDGARFIPAAVAAGASIVVCRPGGAEEAAALAGGCRVVHHSDPREALWRLAEAR
jgi:UDP-N-acetylmuramoyl-L-alanyl-D-glutamate--2,6-diaminopimelate ligase